MCARARAVHWVSWAARDTLTVSWCVVMAAREPGHGLSQTSTHNNAVSEENESENPPEEAEEDMKWTVGNYWGFSLEGIFGLALTFFKGNITVASC